MRNLTNEELELVSGGTTTVPPLTITAGSGGAGWTTFYPDPNWGVGLADNWTEQYESIGEEEAALGWREQLIQAIIDFITGFAANEASRALTPAEQAQRAATLMNGVDPSNLKPTVLPNGAIVYFDKTTGIGYVDRDPSAGNGVDFAMSSTAGGEMLMVDLGDGRSWNPM